jgi:hypothetical protein
MDEAKRQKLTETARTQLAKVWVEPQEGRMQLVVFDTITNERTHLIIGEGSGPDDAVEVSPTAQNMLDRLDQVDEIDREVVVVDLAHSGRTGTRLSRIFASVQPDAAIMLLCRSSEVMDIIDVLLDFLDRQPPKTPAAPRTPGEVEIRPEPCHSRNNTGSTFASFRNRATLAPTSSSVARSSEPMASTPGWIT